MRLILIIMAFVIPGNLFAQCDSDTFLDNCASGLETFTFIKAFNTQMKKTDKQEFSYVFSKGSTYMIIGCDQQIKGERMIVNLYDRNHKLIVSNYNKKSGKF